MEQVAHLVDDVRPDGEHGVACRDGTAEPHVQVGGETACLALARDDPAAHFVDEGGEDAAMHGVDPALEIALGFPLAHYVVAVLKKNTLPRGGGKILVRKKIKYQNVAASNYIENAIKVIENSILDMPDGEYCFQVYRKNNLEQDKMLGFMWKNKRFEKWIN